ncbi:MAG: ABC transporter permease [Burkholderiaceae bacterium]|nr:ABC transporter permease [Burkholderiaceae bacterium]
MAAMRTMAFVALRNLRRNVRRSALSLAAVALGVTGLALAGGFVEDMYVQLAERTIHSQLGHLQVTKSGYREQGAGRPEAFMIEQAASLRRRIAADPEVLATMGRIGFDALLAGERAELAVSVEAIEPDPEARLGTHLVSLSGRALAGDDRLAVMLGEGVAAQLRVAPGALLNLTAATLDGALNSYELEVVGVFRSISKDFDERTVRVPLALAQDLLQTEGVNTIVVQLRSTSATDATLARLAAPIGEAGMEIHAWQELSEFYRSVREMYAQQFGVLQVIALVLMVMGVVNSLNMTVFERTAEFGTMRALGNRGSFVFGLIVLESLLIGALAVLAATVLSLAGAAILSYVGIPMPPPPNSEAGYLARVLVTPQILAWAGSIGLAAAVVAGLAPAWRASSIPVVDGLRHAL